MQHWMQTLDDYDFEVQHRAGMEHTNADNLSRAGQVEALEKEEILVYNLGNGVGYSVREVIETARKVTGHPIPAEETPRRPGDSPRLVASSEKIRRELGWEPSVPDLYDIIESAWVWHQSHPNGYE